MSVRIEWDDVQGNVLNGYGMQHVTYVMLHARSTDAARRVLDGILRRVTSAVRRTPEARPCWAVNVAITYSGFEQLGVSPELRTRFPEAFREGPAARAERLGDTGRSAPETWERSLGSGEVHLLVTLNGRTAEDLGRELALLAELTDRVHGVDVVAVQPTRALKGQREHFGYADGFANPDIEGVLGSVRSGGPGGGVALPGGGWRPLRLGEFLLGHEDEDHVVSIEPDARLVRNGSYVVYRKLYQNVARFRAALQEAAAATGLTEELVAAKVVGRWRDGVPLELQVERDVGDSLDDQADPRPANDFRYLPHDRGGYICPHGAHIRRANPRDALDLDGAIPDSGALSRRHRIIRRGMPYGNPLRAGTEDDREDRGLIFVCFNADIERQYETVQGDWCNDGDLFGLGDDRDYLLGDGGRSGKITIPVRGSTPKFIDARPEFVVTRGTEYLFAPGLQALRLLEAGAFA